MTESANPKLPVPHIVLAVVIIVLVVVGYIFLSSDDTQEATPQIAEPVVEVQPIVEPEPEPEPEPDYATEDDINDVVPEPEPMPEPLDISDATVKTSIISTATYEAAASLIVNDDLLRRFVVLTDNTAKQSVAPRHQIVVPPEQNFRTYEQSGKSFIDAASYKRYTPYVDAFDSMDTSALLSLYDTYKPAMKDIYAEIGDPDDDFSDILKKAINHLLDTPEVPVPVEVYSNSVMYKYKDERLESLSAPQKQLLRTGPENMRRIKAKLRELKDALQ